MSNVYYHPDDIEGLAQDCSNSIANARTEVTAVLHETIDMSTILYNQWTKAVLVVLGIASQTSRAFLNIL